jgi:hypothetical protein
MNKTLSRVLASATLASVASTAMASTAAPVPLPEAGSLGLLAAGVAAGVAALRLRRRK